MFGESNLATCDSDKDCLDIDYGSPSSFALKKEGNVGKMY